MLGRDSVFDDGSGQRAVGDDRVQRGTPILPRSYPVPEHESGEDAVDESPEDEGVRRPASCRDTPEGLPPGVYHSRRVSAASGRAYDVYTMPQGPQAYSRAEVWRRFRAESGVSASTAADEADLREWRDDDEEPLPEAASPAPAEEPGNSSEPQGGQGAVTPSRRQGTRSARVPMPPGGRRGDEDLSSVVAYTDRPSLRRDPVRRHA